ncbi:amino acid ABC transporter permease [Camelimonas lactis]|uniref:Polar amino acid transport system permease protein n=1 Tax=Camelimonas lactis TaxID=659006 RepID=A0A4R2GPP9_9HYPH|nr:amino acid ABC transporter permease [Camelimonas lactis]TCO11189.1 polar amino acid transport system permease protein [Camelimonas lactis]
MSFLQILLQLAGGVGYTIMVTVACSLTGVVVGLGVAMLSRIGPPWLRGLLGAFTFIFRAVPVLVLLFIVFFGLPNAGLRVPPLVAMMLSLGVIAGAYLAEVFRGAFDSVDASEVLAAEAMGLSRFQILRLIEIPQMLRFAVPGMINEFTTVLKYSPFAYTVGIPDVMKEAMSLSATTLRGVEIYLAVGIIYFLIYKLLVTGVWALEKRTRIPGLTG